jgi:hypothetical protein
MSKLSPEKELVLLVLAYNGGELPITELAIMCQNAVERYGSVEAALKQYGRS